MNTIEVRMHEGLSYLKNERKEEVKIDLSNKNNIKEALRSLTANRKEVTRCQLSCKETGFFAIAYREKDDSWTLRMPKDFYPEG